MSGARRLAGLGVAVAVALVAAEAAHAQNRSRFRLPGSDRESRFEQFNPDYDGRFQFVRIRFDTGRGGGFFGRGRGQPPWMHDYPRAERNFLNILDETTYVGPHLVESHILSADDPELFRHPIAYIVEVSFWNPTDEEAASLGAYLRKGGFLIVDDFRSSREWDNFEFQMRRVLPELKLVQLDGSHEIFDSFFRIENPEHFRPATFGQYPPLYYGIFEDNDHSKRLMAIVNFNNDIAEYWEFSDRGYYPIDLSNEAYKLGVNYVVYALTH